MAHAYKKAQFLLGFIACSAIALGSFLPPPTIPATDSAWFAQNSSVIFSDARAKQDRLSELVAFDIEPGTCGIHISDPPKVISFNSNNLLPVSDSSWDFWPATPLDSSNFQDQFGLEPISVLVSTSRLVPNVVATLQKQSTSNGWSIQATFSPRGLLVLAGIHGPTSSSSTFVDWYGQTRIGGGSATPMKASLVYDGLVIGTFDASSLVNQTGPVTMEVAADLNEATADYIINLYHNS
jgi:hypothetical protein